MKIFEFRISLRDVEPEIWRRIQIRSDSSFWYLHCAIQDAMGWLNGHLHCFRVPAAGPGGRIEIGIPDPEGFDSVEILPAWNIRIDEYFTREGDRAEYDYDFGDGWEHDLILERILEVEEGAGYPRCIAGARNCPPEDCGGPLGYERLLKIVTDEDHEEHESMLEWLGGTFDPEAFSVDDVYFLDPESALSDALSEYDDDHPATVVTLPAPGAGSIDDLDDIGDILHKLTYYRGEFQKYALKAAVARKDEITPRLLEILKEFISEPEIYIQDEDRVLHLHVLLLLAQFREKRAFPMVIEVCRFPKDYLDTLLGDFMTEYLDRIIASVFDGDLDRIKSVIEDASLEEYARASALTSLQVLVHAGVLSRSEVIEYYIRLFRGGLEEDYSFVWDELANEAVDLHAVELADDIREKFDEGLLDPSYMTPSDANMELAMPLEEAMARAKDHCRGLIDDAVSILDDWLHPDVEFTQHPVLEELLESSEDYYRDGRVLKRVEPKVGRNDPCPCGSGKKYKKCCGK